MCENPVCARRFDESERRLEKLEKDDWRKEIGELRSVIFDLKASLANLNGRMVGYLAAAAILASVLSGVAQYVLRVK